MNIDEQPGPRQPYEKPGFRTLSLLAEEVMVIGCKLPSTGGPFGGGGSPACDIPLPQCNQVNNVS